MADSGNIHLPTRDGYKKWQELKEIINFDMENHVWKYTKKHEYDL